MRDAFGGAFMLKLFLFFIIIYMCIMAGAISYTKAFRVKNSIINIIEQNSFSGSSDGDTIDNKIIPYLDKVNYSYAMAPAIDNYCRNLQDSEEENDKYIFVNGACIVPHSSNGDVYYEVATFVHIELPFFGININVPVHGESKIITSTRLKCCSNIKSVII